MRIALSLLVFCFAQLAIADPTHALYTEILVDHVDEAGLVDYQGVAGDERLAVYLEQLRGTNPDTLATREERLAFWLNAYNAFTLKLIVDNYPLESIHELHSSFNWKLAVVSGKSVWDEDIVEINGETMSLFDIELKEVWEAFEDPRIHFGLVCASLSCPKLRREAYEAETVDQQLDEQARSFLANESKNRFDLGKRRAEVSEIFNWYKKHFGRKASDRIEYIARFAPEEVAADMRANPGDWKIRHLSYDWGLNGQ